MRVFNLIDKFEDSDLKAIDRKKFSVASQDDLYEKNLLIPIHVWEYPRTADKTLDDPRKLPYLKDLFQKFLDISYENDACLWCNDDTILHPHIAEYVRFHCSAFGACSFFRTEFYGHAPSLECRPEEYARQGRGQHIGRDAFAFSRKWMAENWNKIPDSCLGAAMWDIHMACLIRLSYGIKTTNANIGEQMFPAEPILGYCGHLAHKSAWNMANPNQNPANAHNGKLFKAFAAEHLPELMVTAEGNLA